MAKLAVTLPLDLGPLCGLRLASGGVLSAKARRSNRPLGR
jgi:hypothetical protein